MRHSVLDKDQLKRIHKQEKKAAKAEVKQAREEEKQRQRADKGSESDSGAVGDRKKRGYVLNCKGDMAAEAVTS